MTTSTSLQAKRFSTPTPPQTDGRWARVIARVDATSLDRRLAAGEPASSDRVLAARANLIARWENRQSLADDWERLLTTARRPIVPRSPRVPMQATAIRAAEQDVRELVAMLREPGSVNPRGIALARLLLTAGAGPLYNPRRSADLVRTLRSTTTAMASS
jgi:hypothetical protein